MEKSTKDLTKEKKKTRPLSKELCQEKKKPFKKRFFVSQNNKWTL